MTIPRKASRRCSAATAVPIETDQAFERSSIVDMFDTIPPKSSDADDLGIHSRGCISEVSKELENT